MLHAGKRGLCTHAEICCHSSRPSRPWSGGRLTPNSRSRRTERRADGRFKDLQLATGAIAASLHREVAELRGLADDLRRQLTVAESNSELQLRLPASRPKSGYSKDVEGEVQPCVTSGSAESASGLTASETPGPTKRRRRRKQRLLLPKLFLDDDVLTVAPGRRKSERRGAGLTAGPSMVELKRTRTSKQRDIARRSARDDKNDANDDVQLVNSGCEQPGRRGPDLMDGRSIVALEQHGAATRRDLERRSAQDGKANAEAGVQLVDSGCCEQLGRRVPDLTDGSSMKQHGAATRRDLERRSAQDGKANAEAGVQLVDSGCDQLGRRGPDLADGRSIDTLKQHGAATRRDLERRSAQDGKANAEAGVQLVDSGCEQLGRRGPDLTDGRSIDTLEQHGAEKGQERGTDFTVGPSMTPAAPSTRLNATSRAPLMDG
jgi:hypothetical protein